MYSVSQAYINKLKSVSKKKRRIRGTIGSVPFTENDILGNSFSYTDIAVKSADIKLGGVFVGKMNLTFLKSITDQIPRGTWKDRVINLTIGLEVSSGVWEDVPLKPYTIAEPNHSALGMDIEAYDNMQKFDKPAMIGSSTGTIHGFALLACQSCGVTLGMTAEEMAALPNGNQTLGIYPDNDIETWRDLISWIAVTIGGFATIDRLGRLIFRNWSETPVLSLGVNDRFKGGTWSDFSTKYTAIKVSNTEEGTVSYYSVTPDDGLTLDIGANPLLQYGVESVKDAQRTAILNAVQKLRYVPFTSSSLLDPAFDLGDVISFPNGIANNSKCCVMRIDFSYRKGATLKGYGKNPSLNGARSANDKAISQNARNSKSNGISYYPYINAEEIELTTEETSLYRIEFAVAEETTLTLWHEFKLLSDLVSDTQEVTLHYYYDGDLEAFEPVNVYSEDGYHMFKGDYYLLNVSAGGSHTWEVRALIDGGSASIGIGDLRAMLMGQKMDASAGGDGNINLTDEFTPLTLGQTVLTERFTESIDIDMNRSLSRIIRTTSDGRIRKTSDGRIRIIYEGEEENG